MRCPSRTGNENLQATLDEYNLDDGEDLRDTNARGQLVRNLRSASIVDVDDGGERAQRRPDAHSAVLRVDARDGSDGDNGQLVIQLPTVDGNVPARGTVFAQFND